MLDPTLSVVLAALTMKEGLKKENMLKPYDHTSSCPS
jgi:hypothetical protein